MTLIERRLFEHYEEALGLYPKERILGIFLQGSQNYELDLPNSDVDTKCILLPSIDDICRNNKPISTTHIRENEEHIDLKDVRLMLQTFKKQNLNFLEILFTRYFILNEDYYELWMRLLNTREQIAAYDPLACVRSMRGIAMEKFHAMEHRYPSKIELIDTIGYDPKQLHHLARIDKFLQRYVADIPFEQCMIPNPSDKKYLLDIKKAKYPLEKAREMAQYHLNSIDQLYAKYLVNKNYKRNEEIGNLIDQTQADIIKRALTIDLGLKNKIED